MTCERKWKCPVDFLKGGLRQVPQLGDVPFSSPVACDINTRAGASAAALEPRGLVRGSQGLRRCSRDRARLLTTWRCFVSPGLLLSVRSSHERETKALILSAVIWGFSIAYSCMQFLTDMPVNNNVFMENWNICYSSTPKPSLAG